MALNTIHARDKDLIPARNLTNNNAPFKCELVDTKNTERMLIGMGLEMPSVKFSIRINGHASINERDKIKVLGKTFIAVKIMAKFENQLQARKRADYDNFVGSTIVFLE